MNKISLAIVDDNEHVLEGLKSMLASCQDIHICFTTSNGQSLLYYLSLETPQVVLMDIQLPDCSGIDLCKRIVSQHPGVKVVAFSSFDTKEYVSQLIANGALGYVLKNADLQVLLSAIRRAAAGEQYIETTLKPVSCQEPAPLTRRAPTDIPLTKRERDVLQLMSQNYSQHDIAKLLLLPARTIEMYFQHLSQKLGTTDRAAMVKEAGKRGLLV